MMIHGNIHVTFSEMVHMEVKYVSSVIFGMMGSFV